MAVNFTRHEHGLNLLATFRDFFLTGSCLLCSDDCRDDLICTACTRELPRLHGDRCPRCALPLGRSGHCQDCLHLRPAFDTTLALFRYDFPVDRLIHALKYGHQLGLARWLGKQLANHPELPMDALPLAIPLHAERLRTRGFNQSNELAKALAKKLGKPLRHDCLKRLRPTAPQAQLAHAERHANLRGAFECQADLTGQHILLIDDVMTTGHTLNEASRVLKIHGAQRVTLLVAARAVRTPPDSA